MPPEAPAPSTPTSSSATPKLVTQKFLNKYARSRCTLCKKDISIGDEMEADQNKRYRPGTSKKWLNKRHSPSCLTTSPKTSATPKLVTRKLLNKYARSRCTVCNKKISIGDEMEAEENKRKRPGISTTWLNKRHHPSCPATSPVSGAPSQATLDLTGGGSDSEDGIGSGDGSTQTNSSPPEEMSRSSLGGPATPSTPVPSSSAQSLSPLPTGTSAGVSGAATRDVSTQTDSPPEEMQRVFGSGPVASSTPVPLPSTPSPSLPSTGAAAGTSGAHAAPAAASRSYARGRGYALRSGGSTSRNLAAAEGWTRGVFLASPYSKPCKNTGDDDCAEDPMSPTSISLSAPSPASSPPVATWGPVLSSQPVTRGDHIDPGVTVSGVFKMYEKPFDNRIACQVGKKAKKMYDREPDVGAGERLKKRKPSGLAFPELVYPSRYAGIVVEAFHSVIRSQKP